MEKSLDEQGNAIKTYSYDVFGTEITKDNRLNG